MKRAEYWMGTLAGLTVALACASDANDVDTESHFVCGVDADCADRGLGARCVSGQCIAPELDLSDSRSATTADCVDEPCTGTLREVYRVTPPEGVEWHPGEPLLSTTPEGAVVLLLEEDRGDGVPRTPTIAALEPNLDERFWVTSDDFSPPGTGRYGTRLFTDSDGIAVVDYRSVEAGGNLARITTLGERGDVLMQRQADLPDGIFLMRASAAGAVTMIRSDVFVGVEGPAHPECSSPNAILVAEPDDTISVLRCPEGVDFGRFEAGPSGYTLGGGVHGDPPGTLSADLGDGPVTLLKGGAFIARYDRRWNPVWIRSYDAADIETGAPSRDGAYWARVQVTNEASEFARLGIVPDPYGTRSGVAYFDMDGTPLVALGEAGESYGDPNVDGAGHAVVWVYGEPSPEGVPSGWAEIRKVLRDGTVAWAVPIEFTRGNEGLAVGPSGDVYVAALPAPGEIMVVGGETVAYPELAVLRFTP